MDAGTGSVTASFNFGDGLIVCLYLIAMVGIGLWMSRGQKSTRDYFLGSRNIPWWAVGLAIIATETSALTFIGVPAMAFGAMSRGEGGKLLIGDGSIDFLQIILGYVIARVIVAVMMVPHYFKGDVYSPYQILLKSFGKAPRYLASVFFLIHGALGAGVRIYVTAIPVMVVFRVFYSDWGIIHSIALFTVISILYTYIGGIKAVVWTDVIQFCIFVIGGIFALFYIPTLLSGGWDQMMEIGSESGRLTWIRSGLVGWNEFQAGGGGFWGFMWANIKEIFGGRFNIWMGLIGATIGVMCSHGVDQLNVQRVLTCKNAREGGKAMILSAVLILPLFFTFLMVGVALYAFYKTNGFQFGIIDPWNPLDPMKTPKADYIFPIFIVTHVPHILKGFLVAGILAAAMSSISGALSALGSVSVMDIYKEVDKHRLHVKHKKLRESIEIPEIFIKLVVLNVLAWLLASLFSWNSPIGILKTFFAGSPGKLTAKILFWVVINVLAFFFIKALYKPRDDKYYFRLSRWAVIVVSFVLVLIAYLSQQATLVFNLAFTLAGLTSGALLGAVLFAMWEKRCYPGPIIAGMLTSFFAMAIIITIVRTTSVSINWPWFTPIGTAITLIVAYLAAMGIPRPEKDFVDVEPVSTEK